MSPINCLAAIILGAVGLALVLGLIFLLIALLSIAVA